MHADMLIKQMDFKWEHTALKWIEYGLKWEEKWP